MAAVSFELPEELVEAIAVRVAELVLGEFDRRGLASEEVREYLTVEEVVERFGLSRQRVYDLRSLGRLSRHGDGRKALVRRAELEEYLTSAWRGPSLRLTKSMGGHRANGPAPDTED